MPVFTTIRTITNTAAASTNIIIQAMVPDVVKFHAKGEKEKLLLSIDANWFISGAIVNIGIILFIPFVKDIYLFWTNGQLGFNFTLFLCLASGISFFNFGAGLFNYLSAINDLTAQVIITITRAVIIFSAGYLLINSAGINAIGIGIILSEIAASVLLPVLFVNLQLKRFEASITLKVF